MTTKSQTLGFPSEAAVLYGKLEHSWLALLVLALCYAVACASSPAQAQHYMAPIGYPVPVKGAFATAGPSFRASADPKGETAAQLLARMVTDTCLEKLAVPKDPKPLATDRLDWWFVWRPYNPDGSLPWRDGMIEYGGLRTQGPCFFQSCRVTGREVEAFYDTAPQHCWVVGKTVTIEDAEQALKARPALAGVASQDGFGGHMLAYRVFELVRRRDGAPVTIVVAARRDRKIVGPEVEVHVLAGRFGWPSPRSVPELDGSTALANAQTLCGWWTKLDRNPGMNAIFNRAADLSLSPEQNFSDVEPASPLPTAYYLTSRILRHGSRTTALLQGDRRCDVQVYGSAGRMEALAAALAADPALHRRDTLARPGDRAWVEGRSPLRLTLSPAGATRKVADYAGVLHYSFGYPIAYNVPRLPPPLPFPPPVPLAEGLKEMTQTLCEPHLTGGDPSKPIVPFNYNAPYLEGPVDYFLRDGPDLRSERAVAQGRLIGAVQAHRYDCKIGATQAGTADRTTFLNWLQSLGWVLEQQERKRGSEIRRLRRTLPGEEPQIATISWLEQPRKDGQPLAVSFGVEPRPGVLLTPAPTEEAIGDAARFCVWRLTVASTQDDVGLLYERGIATNLARNSPMGGFRVLHAEGGLFQRRRDLATYHRPTMNGFVTIAHSTEPDAVCAISVAGGPDGETARTIAAGAAGSGVGVKAVPQSGSEAPYVLLIRKDG